MGKRILPQTLTLALSVAVVGCAPALVSRGLRSAAGGMTTLAQQAPAQVINLRKGLPVPKGYGLVTLNVTGIPQHGFGTQSLGSGASTLVIAVRTNSNSGFVTDATGASAIYRASVSGTSATIELPALPMTSSATSDLNAPTSGDAPYVFVMRVYNSSYKFPTKVTSDSGAVLSNFIAPTPNWVSPLDIENDYITDPDITASGEATQSVVPGIPETVAIQPYAMVDANVNTTADSTPDVSLAAVTADSNNNLWIRLSDVASASLGDQTKTASESYGAFQTGGATLSGDAVSVTWTDYQGNQNSMTYHVLSSKGDGWADLALHMADAFGEPTTTNYATASAVSGSTAVVDLIGKGNNGVWDATTGGPLTVQWTATSSIAISPASASVSEGNSASASIAAIGLVDSGLVQPGDKILFSFQDSNGDPAINYTYTTQSSESTAAQVLTDMVDGEAVGVNSNLSAAINDPSSDVAFTSLYTASETTLGSSPFLLITAKSDGSQYNSTTALPTSITARTPGETNVQTNIGGGEPLTVLRCALTYGSANHTASLWDVSTPGFPGYSTDNTNEGFGNTSFLGEAGGQTTIATESVLSQAVSGQNAAPINWATATLLLDGTGQPGADTVQYVDIPITEVASVSALSAAENGTASDGIWDFEIHNPGAYQDFDVFDLETGRSITTLVNTN